MPWFTPIDLKTESTNNQFIENSLNSTLDTKGRFPHSCILSYSEKAQEHLSSACVDVER